MRAFACDTCKSLVFFENDRCFTCDSQLGFDRELATLVNLDGSPKARCTNYELAGCNWLAEPGGGLCHCCRLTRTRPADGDEAGLAAFVLTEAAKRRLVYQLDHLSLPTTPRVDEPAHGIAFDLLSSEQAPVTTGHASGVITIDLAESHDPHREALRVKLAEPYRTLLGHLRHEIGHWYWDVLVDGTPFLDPFRDIFGGGAPWEDWAETFAHYLHIRDTTQTAGAWGVHTDGPDLQLSLAWDAQLHVNPVEDVDSFDELARCWIALKLVLNQLNRSMGSDDLYPFTLTPAVLDKLRFVHVVLTAHRAAGH